MMILGVDPQPSGLVACLREGHFPTWPPPAIQDTTPSVAATEGAQAWNDLHARLERFLGDADLARNARLWTIAQPNNPPPANVAKFFGTLNIVCAGKAALMAAVQQLFKGQKLGRQLRLVIVNDTWVGVYGYRLSERGVVLQAAAPIYIFETGSAFWVDEIVRAVTARMTEDAAGQRKMGDLTTAAMEIGLYLTDAPSDDSAILWTDRQNLKMSSVLTFSRRLCARWTSVRRLAEALPQALIKIAEILDGPSPILLAGVGAGWPFAAQIASTQNHVQTLADPGLALARGAAWWPDQGEVLFAECADSITNEPARETTASISDSRDDIDLKLLAKLAERPEQKP
jgi:hypothetical protein